MKEREYGMDIARVAAMLGILLLHILGQGGLLSSNETLSLRYCVYYLIEIIAYSSVDVFAMLTGWLDTNRTKQPSTFRVIELVAITLFYSVVITGLFVIFLPNKSVGGLKSIIQGFFPVIAGRYWYITCYIPVALLKPYLNTALMRLSNKKHKKLCIILVGLFSVIPTFTGIDVFVGKWGYSTIWLFICYAIGSYLKRVKDNIKFSLRLLWGGYIAIVLFLLLGNAGYFTITGTSVFRFVEYTSPFILGNAIIILLLFSQIQINRGRKILIKISAVAFDVYIIHCHVFVFDYIINGNFVWIDNYPIVILPFALLLTAFTCYCILSFIGILRGYICNKLRIEKLFRSIAYKIDNIIY